MAAFIKGDIVVVPFPFSDLSNAKRRPALVVATMSGNDVVLCQVTSQSLKDEWAVPFENSDIEGGFLNKLSHARPNRLFTCDSGIILYKIGSLSSLKMEQVTNKLVALLTQ